MSGCSIAVVGATGAVGRVFLRILEERRFPADRIRLCGRRSVGTALTVNDRRIIVEEVTPELFDDVDFVFISATTEVSRQIGPLAARKGALVIDDSSAFRMDADVPLVVPEVNADDLCGHRGIVSIPNCSTTPLAMFLNPLNRLNPVRRVIVDTYQSVSGTGAAAVDEMMSQSRNVLDGLPVEPDVYPHRIAFNALPHVDDFGVNGYSTEEMKMARETRKILHEPDLAISATCVRIPVAVGHSEAVHVELTRPMSPEEVRDALAASPGVTVVDDPQGAVYPMPIHAEGKDDVFVGRIRRDLSHPNGITAWLVSDNLRKGAGLNAIQIAEEVLSRGLLKTPGRRTQL